MLLQQPNLMEVNESAEAVWRYSIKNLLLKISQYLQENTCVGVSFFKKVTGLRPCNFIKKETPTRVFSCKICEIFKNTYFEEHLRTAPSESTMKKELSIGILYSYIMVAMKFHLTKVLKTVCFNP